MLKGVCKMGMSQLESSRVSQTACLPAMRPELTVAFCGSCLPVSCSQCRFRCQADRVFDGYSQSGRHDCGAEGTFRMKDAGQQNHLHQSTVDTRRAR